MVMRFAIRNLYGRFALGVLWIAQFRVLFARVS
jgi:hypothetical protein